MRIVPAFVGLVKSGLARSGGLARLGGAARTRWSGVLSQHPLTSSVWGLARWSPAALSGRLAGWTTVRPWAGGGAERRYAPPRPRPRRLSQAAPFGGPAALGRIPPALSTQREADDEAVAPGVGSGNLSGNEARETTWTLPPDALEGASGPGAADAGDALERASGSGAADAGDALERASGPQAADADAAWAGSPVERLVAASLRRASQMPLAAWVDVRLAQPAETPSAQANLFDWAAAVAHRRVQRSPRPAADTPITRGGRGWTQLVEAEPAALTASAPLVTPSLQRLWQPEEAMLPPPAPPSAQVITAETAPGAARVRETVDLAPAAPPPPTYPPVMSGPPSPTRLWQPPAPVRAPIGGPTQARPWVQRTAEPDVAPFVAPPLHPARLWHPPLAAETGEAAANSVARPASAGVVYRVSPPRREGTPAAAKAWGVAAGVDALPASRPQWPLVRPALEVTDPPALSSQTRPPHASGAVQRLPDREDRLSEAGGLPTASGPSPLAVGRPPAAAAPRAVQPRPASLWPLGEPMTTTEASLLTGVTAPRPTPSARVDRLSEVVPTLFAPRQPRAVQRAASAVESQPGGEMSQARGHTPQRLAAPWSEAATVAPHPDWPVLGQLTSLAAPAASEPAAFQALRRLTPARAAEALAALASLPGLGAGETLRDDVRRPMETLTRRDLSGVRVYTSPVAETLGAEAFTTGQRVVFAPGRLNLGTPQGMALLGHELSHVGQRLAFKLTASANPPGDDAEEQAAGQQEDMVRRVVEQGWPEGSRREVRQASRALSAMMQHGGIAPPAGPGGPAGSGSPGDTAGGGGANAAAAGGDGTVTRARLSEAPQTGASAPAAKPDVEALARQVYALLKARLRAERERHA